MDNWELAAAEQLAAACKSVCIALAATKGHLSVEDVIRIARIEEDHQIEFWGLVEGGHDIDIADFRVRVSAPLVFVRLLKNYAWWVYVIIQYICTTAGELQVEERTWILYAEGGGFLKSLENEIRRKRLVGGSLRGQKKLSK